jgi:hypothetical protein
MAFISQDLRYPMAGDIVTFSAVFGLEEIEGTRKRYKLTHKPPESTLELFDEGRQNYLDRNQIKPDVDGVYTITLFNEIIELATKHFSNDGGVGLNKGVEFTTYSDETNYYLQVGRKLTRHIGFSPNSCTLEVYSSFATYNLGNVDGVLTDYADETRAPVLVDGANDRAKIAMQASLVLNAVTAIGGAGYTDISPVLDWQNVIDSDPTDSLAWFILAFNAHPVATIAVHDSADTTNIVTASNCSVGNKASQITLLNDIQTQLVAHFADATAHVDADPQTFNAALSGTATPQQVITKALEIQARLNIHLTRGPTTSTGTTIVHSTSADAANYCIEPTPTSETTAVAAANECKAVYNAHRVVTIVTTGFHDTAYSADNLFNDSPPTTMGQPFITGINKLADLLNGHVTNKNPVTGEAENYHVHADYDNRTDDLPRASDDVAALQLFELLIKRFVAHIGNAAAHDRAILHSWWVREQSGVGTIHAAFETALRDADATVPSTQLTATTKLVQLGGFSKA